MRPRMRPRRADRSGAGLAPCGGEGAQMRSGKFSSMLVATDFSAGSDQALGRAIDLARKLDANVELVHVVDPTLHQAGAVGRELSARAEQARRAGVSCHETILEGDAQDQIIHRA